MIVIVRSFLYQYAMGACDMGSRLRVCSNSPWGRIPIDRLAREVDDSDLMLRGSAHGIQTEITTCYVSAVTVGGCNSHKLALKIDTY